VGLENIESGETPVTAKTQTPKSQSNRFFIVDASECNASKIQPFVTMIQFIKYGDGTKIVIRHEDNEFAITVDPEFARSMAFTISEILDILNGSQCTDVSEG